MDHGSQWDIRQKKGIPYLRRGLLTTHDLLSDLKAFWSNDITLFSVGILHQCNAGTAVRIILNGHHLCGNAMLVPLEVDHAVHPLVTTSTVTHGHLTIVVTTTILPKRLQQRLVRLVGCDAVELRQHLVPHSRGNRVELAYCHVFP